MPRFGRRGCRGASRPRPPPRRTRSDRLDAALSGDGGARNDAGDALASRNWSERHTAVAPSEPPAAKRAPFGPHATDDTETPFVVPKPVFAFVVPEPKESSKRELPAVTRGCPRSPEALPAAALPGDASRTRARADAAAASARPARWTSPLRASTRAVGRRTAPANAPSAPSASAANLQTDTEPNASPARSTGSRGCASTHRAAASPGTPPPANAAPMSGASAAPMAAAAFAATPAAAAANAPVAADQSMRVVSAAAAAAARDPTPVIPSARRAEGAATRNAATARFRRARPPHTARFLGPPTDARASGRRPRRAARRRRPRRRAVRRAWRAGGGERAQVGDDQPLLDARQPDLVRRGGVHARAVEGVAPRARNLDGAAETPSFRRYTRASVFARESAPLAPLALARARRGSVSTFGPSGNRRRSGGAFSKRRAARRAPASPPRRPRRSRA